MQHGDCYNMNFSISKFFIALSILAFVVCAVISFSPPAHTQSTQDTPWNLHTYIWNERINLWARSLCSMEIGGLVSTADSSNRNTVMCGCTNTNRTLTPPQKCPTSSSCSPSFCDGTVAWKNAVKYYHDGKDMDGDGSVTETSTSDIKVGEIRGSAWSPVYGNILFNSADFPVDDVTTTTVNESACYGLTGSARQARVVRVGLGTNNKIDRTDSIYNTVDSISTTKVALVGCAYAPLQKDFILLSPVGSNKDLRVGASRDFAANGDLWSGVHVHTVTDATAKLGTYSSSPTSHTTNINPPYIQLFGCAWSEKNGTWSFGPNINRAGVVDCLPSGANKQNAELLKVTDNTALGVENASPTPTVSPRRSTARIGQRVRYDAKCPVGHSKAASIQIYEDAEDIESLFYPTTPLTTQQIINRIDRYTAAPRIINTAGPLKRKIYLLSEIIFSPVAALRISCFDGHSHTIFPGNSVAINRGVNVESIVFHSFTPSPSVIQEGGLVSLGVNVTNFGNPNSNGGYCTVTNTLSDEQILCFETKGFSSNRSLTLCGSSINNDSCLGDSKDVVVRDARYELLCHYDTSTTNGPDTYRGINFCRSTYNHAGNSNWVTVGPFTTQVKVLPNRLIDRHISGDLSAPTVRKRRDGTNEYVDISIPSADYYGYEVRVHEIDNTKTSIDPDSPDRTIVFFRNTAHADNKTKQRCTADNRPVGETHTACVVREIYGTTTDHYVVIGSLTYSVSKSAFSGKRIVAEIYTDDGRRSEKVAFDPNRIPPQAYLEVKRVGSNTVTLQWDNPNDPTITSWFYRTKKGDGPYRKWRLATVSSSSTKISDRIVYESCTTSGTTNCSGRGPELKNGIEYTFQIRALRGSVYGVPSNPVSARPYRSSCGSVQSSSNSALVADCETLLAIERTLTGGVGNLNWSVTRPITGWNGVSIVGGKLTALRINSRSLGGTIPSELALLDDLNILEMTGNQLAGSIPDELGNMTELRTLSLNNNWLTGSIPDTLARLTKLTYLRLHNNRLTGSVPAALAGLEDNLSSFQINGNNLTGCIPSVFSLTTLLTTRGQEWQVNPQRVGDLTHCPATQ